MSLMDVKKSATWDLLSAMEVILLRTLASREGRRPSLEVAAVGAEGAASRSPA